MTTDGLHDYRRWVRAQGFSPTTTRLLLGVPRMVADYAGCKPAELRADDVVAYLSRDLAPRTRRGYLWAIRRYGEWAGLPDLAAGVRKPREPRGVPRPCSEGDLRALLGAATPRERAWVVLGAYAGLRSFETARVAVEDLVSTSDGPALRVAGKGARVDVVPLPPLVPRELRPWVEQAVAGRLWPGATGAAVQQGVIRAARRAGVRVSSHQLRHRYGSQLYAVSRDLLLVQRLMRHASPVTTMGYAQLHDSAAASLVDLLP